MRALPLVVAVLMVVAPIAGAAAPADVAAGSLGDDLPAADGSIDDSAVDETTDESVAGDTTDDPAAGGPIDDETTTRSNQIDDPDEDEPSSDSEEELTFRVLSTPPDATARAAVHGHGANLGTSLGLEVHDVDAALETEAVVRRIETAETDEERQRRLLAAVNQVEQDEVSLESRQAAAINAHAAGELSDRELLDELVDIAATAREFDRRLDVLDALAEETDGFSSPSRLAELQVQLQVYEGPVRDRALSAVRSGTGEREIYVESSEGTVVLTTIDEEEGEYVREALRLDRWDRGGGTITSEVAMNATARSYPETSALRESDAFGAGAVQRITVPHDFGELRTFVSGGTERVFLEHQRIDLTEFPDYEAVSTSADGFNVTVERSYPGGPVVVTVLDDEDGTPVVGVTVTKSAGGGDSETIGTTDANGVVVTLSPSETYRITVVDEPRVAVIAGIEPTGTPRVADEPTNQTADEN